MYDCVCNMYVKLLQWNLDNFSKKIVETTPKYWYYSFRNVTCLWMAFAAFHTVNPRAIYRFCYIRMKNTCILLSFLYTFFAKSYRGFTVLFIDSMRSYTYTYHLIWWREHCSRMHKEIIRLYEIVYKIINNNDELEKHSMRQSHEGKYFSDFESKRWTINCHNVWPWKKTVALAAESILYFIEQIRRNYCPNKYRTMLISI